MKSIRLWITVVASSLVFATNSLAAATPLTADEIQELAVDAYVYAYPMVLMEITRQVSTNVGATSSKTGMRAGMNQFGHASTFPDDKFDAVVRPNADTLYSSLWYDVSKEPLILSVADSGGRYYLLPLMDMWTDISPRRANAPVAPAHRYSPLSARIGRVNCPSA